jgi:dipeptidyl aminopeptidase/acylaminoacyl peptidase
MVKDYRMIYWSNHIKTEAFVAVPATPGTYPLFVFCHGGWAVPRALTHVSSPTGAKNLQNADPRFITVIPEYRGYAGSDGTVPGLDGITQDTNNAINAIVHHFSVEPDHIYLEGVSMGGGAVLKLASERNDIRSVIAISPFVGWDIVGDWVKHNQNTTVGRKFYAPMTRAYGPFNPSSPTYQKNSIDYKNIQTPTLLLQGTGDSQVAWQTVQTFYNNLKGTNPDTKLILFPGGAHGLHDRYQSDVIQAISQWYMKYGEKP